MALQSPPRLHRARAPSDEMRVSFTTPGKVNTRLHGMNENSSNEENEHNGIMSPIHSPAARIAGEGERTPKRNCVKTTPLRSNFFVDRTNIANNNHHTEPISLNWKQAMLENKNSQESEEGSDVSTSVDVSHMRGLLNDFGKKNKAHVDDNTVGKQPDGKKFTTVIRPKIKSAPAAAMVVVKNLTTPGSVDYIARGPSKTPVRYQSRIKKEEIQATNDSCASVQKLSAWLADGPCSNKKKTATVRRGINIISKSRAFEKDLENVIIEEANIIKGAVDDKKKLFSSDENEEDDNDKESMTSGVSVSAQKDWLAKAFKKIEAEEEKSEDAPVKVSDRKKLLEAAAFIKDAKSTKKTVPPRISATNAEMCLEQSLSDLSEESKSTENIVPQNDNSARLRMLIKKKRSSFGGFQSNSIEETVPTNASSASRKSLLKKKRSSIGSYRTATKPSGMMGLTLAALDEHNENDSGNNFRDDRRAKSEACVGLWDSKITAPLVAEQQVGESDAEASVKVSDRKKWLQMQFSKKPSQIAEQSEPSGDENQPTEDTIRANDGEAVLRKAVQRKRTSFGGGYQKEKTSFTNAEPSGLTLGAIQNHNGQERENQPRRAMSEACVDLYDNGNEGVVDFKAARAKIIERSKSNGNPVNVWSKVQRKQQKFEQLNKQVIKTMGPKGLLKPTWEHSDLSKAASDAYTKNFVDDIAPQKSLEELP